MVTVSVSQLFCFKIPLQAMLIEKTFFFIPSFEDKDRDLFAAGW